MNMKRRNVDCSKLRRPLKRNKITEGIYGSSTFLYVKFLMVWLLVLTADFILDFRFEYLWPFWLLLRSVYDSYKYQGLAFSVFFVCVAVTSDVICYLVIPVQWLFFAASTYVWVQYVWHTERGICFPTVSLWLLCVYIEASVRLRNYKPLPYHMDLCRPFAAHCIGYPVVTLGFGFKSYVSYRLRMRKQKEVERENNFYMQLLQQALPIEQQQAAAAEKQKALPSKSQEDVISNGSAVASSDGTAVSTGNGSAPNANNATNNSTSQSSSQQATSSASANSSSSKKSNSINSSTDSKRNKSNNSGGGGGGGGGSGGGGGNSGSTTTSSTTSPSATGGGGGGGIDDIAYIESLQPGSNKKQSHSINDFDEETMTNEHNAKSFKANSVNKSSSGGGGGKVSNASSTGKDTGGKEKKGTAKTTNTYANNKDESISRLESDIKKLKADLQGSRNTEQELRSQINSYVISDKSTKTELYQLRQDNESLQGKLHNLVQSRQQDKQALSSAERKLDQLRKEKSTLETQLANERRAKKAEEAATARAVAMATAARTSGECSESCKLRRREQENELKQAVRELKIREEQYRHIEHEAQALRQYKESQNDTEVLMSALAAMQDKNSHLENSLSSETRVKLDLFSALGEAKRQIEIQTTLLNCRDMEIAELKSKIAEVLALVPGNFSVNVPPGSPQNAGLGTPHFSEAFACSTPPPAQQAGAGGAGDDHSDMAMALANAAAAAAAASSLNPNASDYTPKV